MKREVIKIIVLFIAIMSLVFSLGKLAALGLTALALWVVFEVIEAGENK